MMYVASGGKVWSAPFGSQFLGVNSDGIPLYGHEEGVGEMKLVNQRTIGKAGS